MPFRIKSKRKKMREEDKVIGINYKAKYEELEVIADLQDSALSDLDDSLCDAKIQIGIIKTVCLWGCTMFFMIVGFKVASETDLYIEHKRRKKIQKEINNDY